MRFPLQQYARTHGLPEAPLSDPRSRAEGATPGLPAAAQRGVRSFYDDLHRTPGAPRVCLGTSCLLAGAAELHKSMAAAGPCEGAYCLGHCDRSPAALLADGRVATACPATHPLPQALAEFEPAPPDIRCDAREAVVTGRIARGDFSPLIEARKVGAYEALKRALALPPEAVLAEMAASGELGRGGAAFPTGAKWRSAADAPGPRRFVVANGDEGDPGSFVDRVLMERDPHAILEGMAIASHAIGAHEGVVFIRSEYPRAIRKMEHAIEEATGAGLLGADVLGTGHAFQVRVFAGMGSYVCGEETALLNAIEGLRGEVRLRPPYPAESGLYGCPTVVNNVETLAGVSWIFRRGAAAHRALGTARSAGTKAVCLNHGFARPGIVEVELGTPLRRVIEELGGGARAGTELAAVILGGPMGSLLTPEEWDVPMCPVEMSRRGVTLGHAGLVAVPVGVDWGALLEHWFAFMQHESCGKCVPCRVGSQRLLELARARDAASRETMERLMDVVSVASLCSFGQSTPGPARSIVRKFGDAIFTGGKR